MSRAFNVFVSVANNPGLVSISAVGKTPIGSIENALSGSGIIIHEICIQEINYNVVTAGSPVVCAWQLCMWDGATISAISPWPISTFNLRIGSAPAAGGVTSSRVIQRSFPRGIVSPVGLQSLAVVCTTFTNLSIYNVMIDAAYDVY